MDHPELVVQAMIVVSTPGYRKDVRVARTLTNHLIQLPHGADRERDPERVRHLPKITQRATDRAQVFRFPSVLLPLPLVCSRNLR